MIKRLLLDSEYTVTSPTTILIKSSISFEAKNLSLMIVTESNKIVYNFACDDLKASVSGQVITLLDAVINLTDSLTIIMSFEKGSEIDKLEENILWNKKIQDVLTSMVELQTETNKILKKIYNSE